MAGTDIKIKVDTSELLMFSRVSCMALDCSHNLGHTDGLAVCGLKRLFISVLGDCERYDPPLPEAKP